jgi:hypothetical protein
MEMEMEVKDELSLAVARLTAATGLLEQTAERIAGVELHGSLERVSAREAYRGGGYDCRAAGRSWPRNWTKDRARWRGFAGRQGGCGG